jgi:hypothetical protein
MFLVLLKYSFMNKLFKLLMFLAIPLMMGMVVSCNDDDGEVLPQAPTITSVTPAEALPGTTVIISGTNLENVSSVQFGGMDATGFNPANNTATSISATVPMGIAAGTQTLTVTSPGGSDTFSFTVLEEQAPAPTITSFSPTEGPVGTQVTIAGTNFSAENIESLSMGTMDIETFDVSSDGSLITFTVPEGATTGAITITPVDGDPVTSSQQFTVITEAAPTMATYSDIIVNAQGVRNQEGKVTAFSAEGETFTLAQGTDEATSAKIDFIAADSGGDDNLDLFSPSHPTWLPGNYYEDSDDQPVVWPVKNETRMVLMEGMDAAAFEAATAEDIAAMTIGDDFTTRIETAGPNIVVLFQTADGKKGLVHWKAHDPNADAGSKADIFTFDIKVLE